MTISVLVVFIRSLILGLLVSKLAHGTSKYFRTLKGPSSKLYFICMLSPLVIPPLLPAYAYSAFKWNLLSYPVANELLYDCILVAKTLPIAFLICLSIKDNQDSLAVHCNQLSSQQKALPLSIKFRSQGICIAIVALLVFQEYEIASLMRIRHWTVDLFNAHAGGLIMALNDSLKMIGLPLIVAFVFIGLAGYFYMKPQTGSTTSRSNRSPLNGILPYLIVLFILISPLMIILWGTLDAFPSIVQEPWLIRETLNSTAFALVGTLCCHFISRWLTLKKSPISNFLLTLPGLCGSLVLGLVIVSLFQLPALRQVKSSVIPLSIGLFFWGLPLTLVLTYGFQKAIPPVSLSCLQQLPKKQANNLYWKLSTLPYLFALFPVYCLLWFDLTLGGLLAPTKLPGLFNRLYNLMHYNENERLSATLFIAVFIPFIILALLILITRAWLLWKNRKYFGKSPT